MASVTRYCAIAIAAAMPAAVVSYLTGTSLPNEIPDLVGTAIAKDGDDLLFGEVDARLYGVDAPESDQECKNASGQKYRCGDAATKTLADLVNGRSVTCKPISRRPDFRSRPWVICYIDDGTLINSELVQAGAAVAYYRAPKIYASEEREAQAAMRGIWAGKFDPPHCFRRWRDKRVSASCASQPLVQ